MTTHDDDAEIAKVELRSRALAFSNSRWRVYLDHVVDARGNEVADYLVVAPLAEFADGVSGVTVVPVVDDRIGLMRVYRHAVGAAGWEAIRGFVDDGESPASAACRELEEEAGLRCDDRALRGLGFAAPEPSTIAGTSALFAATNCRAGTPSFDEIGLGSLTLFSVSEIRTMLERFEIDDCLTVVALYRLLGSSDG